MIVTINIYIYHTRSIISKLDRYINISQKIYPICVTKRCWNPLFLMTLIFWVPNLTTDYVTILWDIAIVVGVNFVTIFIIDYILISCQYCNNIVVMVIGCWYICHWNHVIIFWDLIIVICLNDIVILIIIYYMPLYIDVVRHFQFF